MAQIDENIIRDLTVGRNVTIGGDQIVRGNMHVENGLVVKGWIKAENINFPTVGVFASLSDLNTAYPAPQKPGQIAGVLDTSGNTAKVILYWSQAGDTPWATTTPPTYMSVKTILSVTAEGISVETAAELQREIDELDGDKADKLPMSGSGAATENNFMAINASGNIKDSGKSAADFATSTHTHSDYATKVGSGHTNNIAKFNNTGNLADSGYSTDILEALGIQTCYFNGDVPRGADIETVQRLDDNISPDDYGSRIYYAEINSLGVFACKHATDNVFYTHWGKNGEQAYMSDGKIKRNKLYVGAPGEVYFCSSNYRLVKISMSDKADKDTDAVDGNFAAFDANGNIKDSGHKHSDYLTSHQNVDSKEDKDNKVIAISSSSTDIQYPSAKLLYDQLALKANKSEMTVSTDSGVTIINLKGSGAGATKVELYSQDYLRYLLSHSIVNVVTCVYNLDAGSNLLYSGDHVVMAAVNEELLFPINGEIGITVGSAQTVPVRFVFREPSIIPDGAFAENTQIVSVIIPSYVTLVGEAAFYGCRSMKTLRISSGICQISGNAFNGCKEITDIICEGVTPPTYDASTSFAGIDMSSVKLHVHHVAMSEYENSGNPWAGVLSANIRNIKP